MMRAILSGFKIFILRNGEFFFNATPLLLSYIDFIIAYSSKLIKAGID